MTIRQKLIALLVLWLVDYLDGFLGQKEELKALRDLIKGAENV